MRGRKKRGWGRSGVRGEGERVSEKMEKRKETVREK